MTRAAEALPKDVHLAVIGAGALGCALLPRLIRHPLEALTLVDGDLVEQRNLDRQDLFAAVDIGRPKASVAAAWLRNAPGSVKVAALDAFISPANAEEVIRMHDLVVDLTDDAHARRLIDRTCAAYGVALVSAAVHGTQGQVIVLHAPGRGEELLSADLFPGSIGPEQDGCDMRRVPDAVVQAVAGRTALRVRQLLQGEAVCNGHIDLYDHATGHWTELTPAATSVR